MSKTLNAYKLSGSNWGTDQTIKLEFAILRRQVSVEQYGEQMLHTFQVVNKEKQSTIELDYVDLQFKLLN